MAVAGRMRGAALMAAAGALVVVAATADRWLRHAPAPIDPARELVYVPDAKLLRPLVLGYDNVLADVLWFRTINYFGAHYDADRTYPWLARMCDVVTDLDPRAEHVYRFAGVILPWEANEVDDGIRLLQKGIRELPNSWTLHYLLGISLYFFRDDYGSAAEHLRRAAALPGSPPGAAHMAAVLHARQYGAGTTLAFLREMYRQTDDPTVREVIGESLKEAQLAADVERLAPLVATYRKRHGRFPPSLTALVGAGLLKDVPPDPFGGAYEIDATTGALRSSTGRTPRHLADSPGRQRQREKLQSRTPAAGS